MHTALRTCVLTCMAAVAFSGAAAGGSFGELQAKADRGNAEAQYELARHYNGLTGERFDREKAFAYTRKAAEQGHVAAQVELAFLYFNGNEKVAKDLPAALRWFRQAAQQRSVAAQCMLGDFHRDGLGGAKQDPAEAFRWYKSAATQDDPCAAKAQFELYQLHEAGKGTRKDLPAATAWLKRAAEARNPKAQATLGRNYAKGYGVPRDAKLATEWLRKSREGVAPHDLGDRELEHDHARH
jgi:TPR repeat protein